MERKSEREEQHSISDDFEEYAVAYNYGNTDHEVVYISDDDSGRLKPIAVFIWVRNNKYLCACD